ncbi:MAG: cytochrome c oxidase subunit II [Desulfurococcales archaeon]|nr:cytochrome c oxidase subunit II [Desulfurococcales archaeon]MCE4604925.1 cytochrome c oxidase subunit II [Desulfurococcales archaeon]
MANDEGLIYEYVWIVIVASIVAGMAASLAYYGIALDLNPACNATPIDVTTLTEEFQPGVKQIAPGVYQVNILAGQFFWNPNKIVLEDPVRIEFRITSKDVVHGFEIVGTNVNVMVFPGYVAEFVWEPPKDAQGKYLIICHEYCGIGHQYMQAELEIKRSNTLLSQGDITNGSNTEDVGEFSKVKYLKFNGVIVSEG